MRRLASIGSWFGRLSVVAFGLNVGLAAGQPAKDTIPPAKLTGSSLRAAARLAAAQGKVDRQQWTEAIAEYQAILDESGDELVPLDPKVPNHCVAVRRICHLQLARLPAAAMRLYRLRVDDQAKKRLDQAVGTRDMAGLQRIVDDMFCSRPAERAVDLLGDFAFERGEFVEAERWWRMLALPCSEASAVKAPKTDLDLRLVYPDPQAEPALVRGKQILALLYRGDRQAGLDEFKAFAATHAKAEGYLAGRKGNLVAIVQGFIDQKEVGARPTSEIAWTTFGGDATRTPPPLPLPRCRWLQESWRARLDGKPVEAKGDAPRPIANATEAGKKLAFHPLIIGDRVVVADARSITVFDALTGRQLAHCDLVDDLKQSAPILDVSLPVKHGERYTLTALGQRLFVRLGSPAMTEPRTGKDGVALPAGESYLVCLDLALADGALKARWIVAARTAEKEAALFEGSPLAHEGRLYIARTRFKGSTATTEIDCYDADTGARRWRQEVCEAQELGESDVRYRQHLLTLAGPNVAYCSHSGAVVALDVITGKRSWAVRYPRRGPRLADGTPSRRDLCPAVFAYGRLYVAPGDCDRILCLDALTGRALWESKPIEVVHLLGVTYGRLVFTTGTFPRGIRALDAIAGTDVRDWLHPADGSELPSLGRGIFAGNRAIWPTVDGLRILKQDTGQVDAADAVALATVKPGNIAVGNGCLVVATDRELLGFVAPTRLGKNEPGAEALPARDPVIKRLAVAAPLREDGPLNPPAAPLPFRADLPMPLTRNWEIALGQNTGPLLVATPPATAQKDFCFFINDSNEVTCRDASTGRVCWQQPLDASVTWAARCDDTVLVAGRQGVFCLRLADGKIQWTCFLPKSPTADQSVLSEFRREDSRLFFFQDQCRLFAIDVRAGQMLWNYWAPAAEIRPLLPGGRFHPFYHVGNERLLVQTSMGKAWLVDGRTGRTIREAATGDQGTWLQPPAPLDDRCLCVVPDARRVVMLDMASGKEIWSHKIAGTTTLSGESPQVFILGDTLLLRVPRNYGYELERLDVATGQRKWPKPVLLGRGSSNLRHAAADGSTIYMVCGNVLEALALDDGRRRWQARVEGPGDDWRVAVTKRCLLVYPRQAQSVANAHVLYRRAMPLDLCSFLPTQACVVRGLAGMSAEIAIGQSPGRFSIFLCDAKDGQVIQRLDFVGSGGTVQAGIFDKRLIVAMRGTAWGLQ
jgi:outer membrane protein assembly factor BamB